MNFDKENSPIPLDDIIPIENGNKLRSMQDGCIEQEEIENIELNEEIVKHCDAEISILSTEF